jgi:serine/threonine protein kinase
MAIECCPSPWELDSFLSGDQTTVRSGEIASHLKACADCRTSAKAREDRTTTLEVERPRSSPEKSKVTGSASGDEFPIPNMAGYVDLEEIGRDGMGVVYRAMQVRPPRPVALKMLRGADTGSAVARFVTEAEAVASLRHPNIIQIHKASEHDGRRQRATPQSSETWHSRPSSHWSSRSRRR